MMNKNMNREGMSLTEVMVAAVIMAIAALPVMAVFGSSNETLERTDTRRTARRWTREVLERAKRQSLHDLWDNFGPQGKLRDRVAEMNNGKLLSEQPNNTNPLGFTQDLIDEMRRDGLEPRLKFEFYTRRELGVKPENFNIKEKDKADPVIGLLHMQAGWAEVTVTEAGSRNEVISQTQEPIMCAAIVGRPGMKMSSCPAVNATVRKKYGPLVN